MKAIPKQNLRTAWNLALSDFKRRYARSVAGPLWLFITPAGLLTVYWLVFGAVLKVRWPALDDGREVGFLLPFFCGLSVFLFFSDVVTSSTGLFVSKRNFVRKSPFPLWVLWLSNFLRCCLQGAAYLTVLLILTIAYGVLTPLGALFAFFGILGVLCVSAAFSLVISAIGPFAGDISESTRIALRLLFYSAPVTYPMTAVAPQYHFILWLNPLTHMIEPLRSALLYGAPHGVLHLTAVLIAAAGLCVLSWLLLVRVSDAIPDVV